MNLSLWGNGTIYHSYADGEIGEKGVVNRILKETENYVPYAHRLGKSFFNGYLRKIENRGKIRSK
jgi:hypothetical protein